MSHVSSPRQPPWSSSTKGDGYRLSGIPSPSLRPYHLGRDLSLGGEGLETRRFPAARVHRNPISCLTLLKIRLLSCREAVLEITGDGARHGVALLPCAPVSQCCRGRSRLALTEHHVLIVIALIIRAQVSGTYPPSWDLEQSPQGCAWPEPRLCWAGPDAGYPSHLGTLLAGVHTWPQLGAPITALCLQELLQSLSYSLLSQTRVWVTPEKGQDICVLVGL